MLPVPEDGDSRLPCRAKVVLGLGIADVGFTPSVLGAEAALPLALEPNNLNVKQIALEKLIAENEGISHESGFYSQLQAALFLTASFLISRGSNWSPCCSRQGLPFLLKSCLDLCI